jgi:hypothetical protein
LQSALCARAGDVAKSKDYTDAYCLQWKHINIKLATRENGLKTWVALVTLAYTKGYKDDASKNHKVMLESITEPEDLIVCPVKWLLILALRTSAVAHTNIENLQAATDMTVNKSLVWQTPDRPVLSAFKQQGCMLDLRKPAREVQLLKTLKQGCDLIGLLSSPVTHDVRRGAAAEIAHLPKHVKGGSTADAARTLNHQGSVRERGLTASYVGYLRDDTWKRRLEAPLEDVFTPDVALQPFKRSRQSTAAVLDVCDELGLDYQNRKHRDKARGVGRVRLRDKWANLNTSVQLDDTAAESVADMAADEAADSAYDADLVSTYDQDDTSSESSGNNKSLDDSNIDPQLLALSQLMTSNTETCDLAAASTILDSVSPAEPKLGSVSHVPTDPIDFITKFSKHNECRNEVAGGVVPVGAVTGGSRDPPSRWLYSCINAPACTNVFQTRHLRDSHGKNCDPSSKVIHPFACTFEACDSTFPDQTGLNVHLQYVHGTWIPIGCDEEGCNSLEIFQTRGAHMQHRQNFHSDWSARKCPVPTCPVTKTFEKRNAFIQHLKDNHPDRKDELMPAKTKKRKRASLPETVNWIASECLYPGCPSQYLYDKREKYVQHLRIMHGIYSKDAAPHMPPHT